MKMDMKRLALATAVVIAVALSGCMEKAPSEALNSTQIKSLLLDSTEKLNSYQFEIETSQESSFVNLSGNESKTERVTVTSNGKGSVDLEGKYLQMVMTTLARPEGDPENETSTESESYFVNDTIYMKMNGNWTKLALPDAEGLWDRQNMIKNQAALLNTSELEMLGSEKIDGADCYKIKVVPDMRTYASVLSEQMGSSMPLMFLNISALFNQSEMTWTAWVTADEKYLKKIDIKMKMSITPELMNLPLEALGKFRIDSDTVSTTTFGEYNKPVKSELPEEALNLSIPAMMITPSATT
ncbi:MAG: hypothetical protein A4E47_00243 [Methanosaeta sp. PtaU1.Bin028]|nr:MAG: hypothetical protein A4E47_00243 [Methanosaeta sp. PtaU1.Bin028]